MLLLQVLFISGSFYRLLFHVLLIISLFHVLLLVTGTALPSLGKMFGSCYGDLGSLRDCGGRTAQFGQNRDFCGDFIIVYY